MYKEYFQGAQFPSNTILLLALTCFFSVVTVFLLGFFLMIFEYDLWLLIQIRNASPKEARAFKTAIYRLGKGKHADA